MARRPIKVLIVEDSLLAANILSAIIRSDPDLQVIGHVNNGESALGFIQKHTPDVITMDIIMPGINGFETTHRIMQTKPIPIIIISASFRLEDVTQSFQSISAGALDILEKPRGVHDSQMAQKIIESIKTVVKVKLTLRHHTSSFSAIATIPQKDVIEEFKNHPKIAAIALGASLGGPKALYTIFSQILYPFPVPIFVVQHISQGFSKGLVNWLKDSTTLKIVLAEDCQQALPGYVYIAPDHYHMEINKGDIIRLVDSPSGNLTPSVGRLFRSMANTYGPQGVGIILTGMGQDGVNELLLMKEQGAVTIAQDQDSSLLFGMPKAAIAKGAAKYVMSLAQIASILKLIVKRSKK